MTFKEIKDELSVFLKGLVLIVGIGNQMRSDDGIGSYLIEKIKGRVTARCIDTGLSPENYIGKIIKLKPDAIVFIDAARINESPGSVKLIHLDQIPEYGFSTHNMSPKLFIENIQAYIPAAMIMIGIEPKTTEFGESMSEEMQETLKKLENIFIELIGKDEKSS